MSLLFFKRKFDLLVYINFMFYPLKTEQIFSSFYFIIILESLKSNFHFLGRRWPIILGGGFGVGAAWANCSKDINKLTASSKPKVCTHTK